MSIFYSPSRQGFFDEAIHGPRQIEVVDEKALGKALANAPKDIAGDEDLKAAIDAASEPVAEDEDKQAIEARVAKVLEEAIAARVRAIANEPPTMIVDNLACLIPDDAVELGADQYATLLAELSEGKVMAMDGKTPVAVDRELPIEEQLAAIRTRRDRELKATDWTQIPDALTEARRKLWAAHRQALRDLPGQVAKAVTAGKAPDSVKFPKAPAK